MFEEVLPQIRKTGEFKAKPQQELNIYARRVLIATHWDIPIGYWCVFHEISRLASFVGEQYPVHQFDLIDGSVGKCWANYRKDKEWAKPYKEFVGKLGDHRDNGTHPFKAYDNSEWVHFRYWLDNTYTLEKLPKYLEKKYGELVKVS